MNLPADDLTFLTGLVKLSRQRVHHIHWVDRDGSNRNTAVTAAEMVKINELCQQLAISKAELLQRAAHIPVAKRPSAAGDEAVTGKA